IAWGERGTVQQCGRRTGWRAGNQACPAPLRRPRAPRGGGENALCAAHPRHSACATPRSAGTSHRLPWLMRALNSLSYALNRCGLPPLRLSDAALMAAAQRRTGLSDWGDASFREAFRRLLEAYECTANLHLLGRLALRQECLRLLSNRLRMQEDLKRFPCIEQTPIRKPLVIVGLPRTGTTLLHQLLAQDPSARVPRLWELLQPSPPPCPEALATEPRRKQAEQMIRRALAFAPHFQALHPLSATGPEECIFLRSSVAERYDSFTQ